MRKVLAPLVIVALLAAASAEAGCVGFKVWEVEVVVKASSTGQNVHAVVYLRRVGDLPDREVSVFLRLMGQGAKGDLWYKDFKVYYGRYMQIPKNTWLKLEADIPLNATAGEWVSAQVYVNDVPTKQWFKSDIARLCKVKAGKPTPGLVKAYVNSSASVVNPGSKFKVVVGVASGKGFTIPLENATFRVYFLTPEALMAKEYWLKAEALYPFYFNFSLKVPVPRDAFGPVLYELDVKAYDPGTSFRTLKWMGRLATVNVTGGIYNASLSVLAKAFMTLAESHKGLLAKYEEVSGKYSEAEAKAMALAKYVDDLKAELDSLKGEAEEWKNKFMEAQLSLVKAQGELDKARGLISVLNRTIAKWESDYKELKEEYEKTVAEKDAKISALAQQVAKLQKEVADLKDKKAKLEANVKALNQMVNDLQMENSKLKSELADKERMIRYLEFGLIGLGAAAVGLGVVAARRRPARRPPPPEEAEEGAVEI